MRDALLHIDSLNSALVQAYAEQRRQHYEREFEKISNVTILDPDSDCSVQHAFESGCYQNVIQKIITKYQMLG
jgi:hypothetical protein